MEPEWSTKKIKLSAILCIYKYSNKSIGIARMVYQKDKIICLWDIMLGPGLG